MSEQDSQNTKRNENFCSWRKHRYVATLIAEPAKLSADLPSSKKWEDWLEKKARTVEKQREIGEGRRARMASLARADRWVRLVRR